MDYLEKLNAQQRQAVTAGLGQILVLAGPGSGKTRVLTYRVAQLIGQMGVAPYHILSVTFTNKAAREMQNRLTQLIGPEADQMWLGTFHSICAKLLRREAAYLQLESNFVIMDADDQVTLVKRIVKDLNLNDKQYKPASLHAAISTAKNNLQTPKDLPIRNYRDEIIVRVYERYLHLMRTNNAVDFDDLLFLAVRLLQDNPEVCEKYSRRFEHILVDEFQDTNMAQYELLRRLAGYHKNIFVVGDEDQSIYRWRGADYRNVLRFEEDYPNCQKVLLEENYRSTQTLLDVARTVIDRNQHRTPKRLSSARGKSGEKINVYTAVDDRGEAAFVVDTIQKLLKSKQASGGEIAVMYRTNAQSRLLEEAFLQAGLPYRLVGAQRFYGRREVKDIIAMLRLVQNPADEISLLRVINTPPRGIGDKTVLNLQMTAMQHNLSAGQVLLDMGKNGPDSPYWKSFTGRGAVPLADFGAMLAGWYESAASGLLPALFDRVINDCNYQSYIDDGSEEGTDRWGNVQELRKLAYDYQDRGLIDFLENLALVSDQDTLPEGVGSAPTLLTLHAAKGLEFERVFITGLDEGLLPHSRSLDDPEEMAEERRLFYVGLTRAKDVVYLVRSAQRSTYGSSEASEPSRFLRDLPAELVLQQGLTGSRRSPSGASDWRNAVYGGGNRKSNSWDDIGSPSQRSIPASYNTAPPRKAAPPPVQQRFKATMHVTHPTYGEGVVLESRMEDGDETVDVHFKSVGFKRLIASLAHLEIID
jgi:DNA helicase II / ATP-dependent DNA helicase PcrA